MIRPQTPATDRMYCARNLNAAGELRRRQLRYPEKSWSECREVRRLIRFARLTRGGLTDILPARRLP